MTRGDLLAKIDAIRKRATEAQHRAADPGRSVWVSANAGTGKTRVLTNRILRLLVDGAQVADILAVTYTRMAAQEMRNRVFDTLSEWAVSNGSDLEKSMRETGLNKPTEKQKQRARQLFATLLDQPVGLRIETIHAFSQSVLRRFPVEAGIQPNFELATEAQITQLQQETATQLLASTDPLVSAAIKSVAQNINTDQFFDQIRDFGKYPGVLRRLRANLLDELRKPYVVTARAKGLSEMRVIVKYPVRAAMNPFASTLGYIFPFLVSGSIIVSLVLSLPTVGPLLYKALIAQDLFLSGTILLLLAILTVVGTFISDLVLMWIDPRIRHGMEGSQ